MDSDPTTEILDPDDVVQVAAGRRVTVRELNWKQTKQFLGTLAGRAAEFLKIDAATGTVDVDQRRLVNVIATDLGEALIVAATDLTATDLEEMPVRDVLRLLERAVALNLRPEMIEAGKAVAGRFAAMVRRGA